MADPCNGTHYAGDLYVCHNLTRLDELNNQLALKLLPVAIYLGILMFAGLFGNVLVWYIYYFRFKKTPYNYFILCLATLDWLTCFIACSVEIYDMVTPLMFDIPVACKIMRFLETITTVASGITLVVVGHDRYRKVFKPFKRISNKMAKIVSCIAVAIGLFVAWPAILIYGSHHVDTEDPNVTGVTCSLSDNVRDSLYPKLYSAFLLLLFFVGVGALIVFYAKIGLEIRKRRTMRLSSTPITSFKMNDASLNMEVGSQESSSAESSARNDSSESYKPKSSLKMKSADVPGSPSALNDSISMRQKYYMGKTTHILFCVSVAFVLSFLPYVIVKIVQAASKNLDIYNLAYCFATPSFLINAAVNPIIYSCLNAAFRNELKALLTKCIKIKR